MCRAAETSDSYYTAEIPIRELWLPQLARIFGVSSRAGTIRRQDGLGLEGTGPIGRSSRAGQQLCVRAGQAQQLRVAVDIITGLAIDTLEYK